MDNPYNSLNYRFEQGEGNPVVFLHGWLDSIEGWDRVSDELDIENPKLFYDQRCHGESGCEDFDFYDLADDLHELIEHQGLEQPALVGHSMGGMVGLTYSIEYSNFSGLMLLATSASTPEPENESPKYFLEKLDKISREKWADEIAENYASNTDYPEFRESSKEILMNADERAVRQGLKSMIEYDLRDQLSEIDKPALVITGSKDGAITPHKTEELAQLIDADFKQYNCTHLMLQEKPEKVAKEIEKFVDKLEEYR